MKTWFFYFSEYRRKIWSGEALVYISLFWEGAYRDFGGLGVRGFMPDGRCPSLTNIAVERYQYKASLPRLPS
jgi:hypothetical protein